MSDKRPPRWIRFGERERAIQHLMMSTSHLRGCSRHGFARELIVQALDLLPRRNWRRVVDEARAELEAEARRAEHEQ